MVKEVARGIDEHFTDKEVGYSESLELEFEGKKPLAHLMRCRFI